MISHSVSLRDVKKIAENIAFRLRRGDVVTLAGDLGAGKTSFAQFLIQALSETPVEVTSPTFTLLQTYPIKTADGQACELYHYDLYRIEHASQLVELGFEDALAHITLIEWPERLGNSGVPIALALSFQVNENGNYSIAMLDGDARFNGITL